MICLEIYFWISFTVIVYTYAGYPILLFLAAKMINRVVNKKTIAPTVSLIIAAYNEEDEIQNKIANSLDLDYPHELLEIIIASDGSTDNTDDIVSRYVGQGVKLLTLPRRGKIFALNEAVNHAKGEILVFSDANSIFQSSALKELVSNFSDTEVGGVCGNQMHYKTNVESAVQGESIYWIYDKWIKKIESLTGSIVSADGAIYAIRRELYQMPEVTACTDDFAISTGVIEKGHRLVFESKAVAYEHLTPRASVEFNRKVRIITRGLTGVLLRKKLLNPFRYGFYSLILFSHKILRRIIPFFLILLFIFSLYLGTYGRFYLFMMLAQVFFYLCAIIGYYARETNIRGLKIFTLPFFICLANTAAFLAVLNFISGKRIQHWDPQR